MGTNYQKINNITGWLVFGIATLVYILTVEDTASFWDCGEFIAVSYKLEVPHPPGAPLFLLIGRMFSFLALGDVTQVAYWINMVSVLSSGFTILFMFWTLTLLGRKLLKIEKGQETNENTILLMGSAIVGSLAYTFTDSFWFSAVEAEVYAMSSFFTAFVVWAILKWEVIEDESEQNRWLILIAYMIGLSIGVHLLNLVTLPALALIYYFKKHEISTTGIVVTLGISGVIIMIIMAGVIPGLPSVAGTLEILFVNTFGLPFGSGTLFFVVLFIGALVAAIIYSEKNKKAILNTILLSFAFILIGYASYTLVLIRSDYNPPIDENNPENVLSFVSYLKREQYGERPLFTGPYFTAGLEEQKQGAPVYTKGKDKYVISDHKIINIYDPKQTTIFPRAWSSDGRHQQEYRRKMGLKQGQVPTFSDNIAYLFNHQIGHMYMRYFLWNFVGRESDFQNAGVLTPLGAFEDVPEVIANNKARNNYYMLPLILGLFGLFFHYSRDKKSFSFVAMLFFLTGIALVLYLNSPPIEPRERDYIYSASFYAFAIWIGFGVIGLHQLIAGFVKNKKLAPILAISISLIVPVILAAENWDDHDRSNRYFSIDSAKNFLESLAPNAIIFTGGDNDTFPLWYVQEVEGFRTDVRVIVLSYFNTDWYIEQMTRNAYESEPLPFSLDKSHYAQGGPNDYIPYVENPNVPGAIDLKQYMGLIRKNSKALQVATSFSSYNSVPSKTLAMNVDATDLLAKGLIPESKVDYLVNQMQFNLKSNKLYKSDLMVLDLIANSNWERPIYFNNTSLQGINFDASDYVIQEGNAFRLLPLKRPDKNQAFVNTDIMYDNMMNKFWFRELDNPDSYYNDDYRGFVQNHRFSFNTLAEGLLQENKPEKAKEVLYKSLELMPDNVVYYDYSTVETISLLVAIEDNAKALELSKLMGERAISMLDYLDRNETSMGSERQKNVVILNQVANFLRTMGEDELAQRYNEAFRKYYQQ